MVETIDGAQFARMVIHGAACIRSQKQEINDLNVFPVPDGDTGTNMSMTIGHAVSALQGQSPTSIGKAASITANALLRGARGNSGVILSLLFRGFSKAVKEKDTIDGRDYAIALDYGVAAAYKAVMKPAEGTILTVSRMCAAGAAAQARKENTVESVLQAAIESGEAALEKTVEMNPVLKKAGVVDAGGKGFLLILHGMLDELQGLPLPEETSDAGQSGAAQSAAVNLKYAFRLELSCRLNRDCDRTAFEAYLKGIGEDLTLTDENGITRLKLQTDRPDKALKQVLANGTLLNVSAENQKESVPKSGQEAAVPEATSEPGEKEDAGDVHAAPAKKFGSVAVCAGEGLSSVFRDLGVDTVVDGGQTNNPSTEDILKAVNATPAEVVFVFPNNKNIIMAAEQCIPLVEDKKVIVVPSKTVPQGITALLNIDLSDETAEPDSLLETLNASMANVHTSEVTYAAHDRDYDGQMIKQGDYLALSDGKLFGCSKDLMQILQDLAATEIHQNAEFITIYFGSDVQAEDAEKVQTLFQNACANAEISLLDGGQPIYYYIISAE